MAPFLKSFRKDTLSKRKLAKSVTSSEEPTAAAAATTEPTPLPPPPPSGQGDGPPQLPPSTVIEPSSSLRSVQLNALLNGTSATDLPDVASSAGVDIREVESETSSIGPLSPSNDDMQRGNHPSDPFRLASRPPSVSTGSQRGGPRASGLAVAAAADGAPPSPLLSPSVRPAPATPERKKTRKGLSSLPLAKAVVNRIAEKTAVVIEHLNVVHPETESFDIELSIRIFNNYPVKAKVSFPDGLDLFRTSSGRATGVNIDLPSLHIRPTVNGSFLVHIVGRVNGPPANLAGLVYDVLTSTGPLDYTIFTPNAQIKAYKLRFGGIRFEKMIDLGGMDCLSGALGIPPTRAPTAAEEAQRVAEDTHAARRAAVAAGAGTSRSTLLPGVGAALAPATTSTTTTSSASQLPAGVGKLLHLESFDIVTGTAQRGIDVRAVIKLDNPSSNIAADLSTLKMKLAVPLPSAGVVPAPAPPSTSMSATSHASPSTAEQAAAYTVLGQLEIMVLQLKQGENLLEARGCLKIPAEEGPKRDAGVALMRRLLENRPIDILASMYERSSPYPWLNRALEGAALRVQVPPLGMRSRILDGASLIAPDHLGGPLTARATLRNGLGPPLRVHSLYVDAVKETSVPGDDPELPPEPALRLGVIDTDEAWPGLLINSDRPNHASLPFAMTEDSASYVAILRHEAEVHGIALGHALEEALELMPTINSSYTSSSASHRSRGRRATLSSIDTDAQSSSQQQQQQQPGQPALDLPWLVARVLSSLHVSAQVTVEASLGDYRIPGRISFVQDQLLIAINIHTARHILPVVGQPLVKVLLEQARVSLGRLEVLHMDEQGLSVMAEIELVDFGPLDIEVYLDRGLDLVLATPQQRVETGTAVAHMSLSGPLQGVAGSSEKLRSLVQIAPLGGPRGAGNFAAFVAALITEPEIQVHLETPSCTIVAGQAEFRTALSKTVSIGGLDNLGKVRLSGFEILGEGPAPSGGGRGRALSFSRGGAAPDPKHGRQMSYRIRATVHVEHPGRLGLVLGYIEAGLEWQGVQVGLVAAEDVAIRPAPHQSSEFEATGHIFVGSETRPEGMSADRYRQKALDAIGDLVSKFLAGDEVNVTVRGYRAFAAAGGGPQNGLAGGEPAGLVGAGPTAIRLRKRDSASTTSHGSMRGSSRRNSSPHARIRAGLSSSFVAVGAPLPAPSSPPPPAPSAAAASPSLGSRLVQRSASQSTSGSGSHHSSMPPPSLAGTSVSATGPSRRRQQVPWLDQAFQSFCKVATLEKGESIDPVKSLTVSALEADFVEGGAPRVTINGVEVVVEVPLPVSYEIVAITAEMDILYSNHGLLGRAVIDETDVVEQPPPPAINGSENGHAQDSSANGHGSSNVDPQAVLGSNGVTKANGKLAPAAAGVPNVAATDTAAGRGDANLAKRVQLLPSRFTLVPDNESLLSEAIAHICSCETTDLIRVTGSAQAKLRTALGVLWVTVSLQSQQHALQIQGLRNLESSPVQYTNLQVVEASPSYLKIVFSLYLHNPSRSLSIRIADSEVSMAAYYRDVYVGRAYIGRGGLNMPCGPVAIHDIHFRYCPDPSSEAAVRDIPANFLSGRTSTLEIRGDEESIADQPVLSKALAGIRLRFDLKPMISASLIDSIAITLGVGMLTLSTVSCEFTVLNPLGVPFDLCALSFVASYRSQPFGSCTVHYAEGSPLRVPPGTKDVPGKQTSSPVEVALAQPLESLVRAFLKEKGTIYLDVELSAKVEIGGFAIPVFEYRQPRLPLIIKGLGGVGGLLKFLG